MDKKTKQDGIAAVEGGGGKLRSADADGTKDKGELVGKKILMEKSLTTFLFKNKKKARRKE